MKHPLQIFPNRNARWIILPLLLGLNVWLGVKAGGGGALINREAPYGIVSLELAGTPSKARKVIESWNQRMLRRANEPRRSVYFDFAYLLFYSNLLALCCVMSAETWLGSHPGVGRGGFVLAWSQYAAALFDAIENCALLKMLPPNMETALTQSDVSSPWPEVALVAASLKFIIIVLGVLYILISLLSYSVGVAKVRRRAKKGIAQEHVNSTMTLRG